MRRPVIFVLLAGFAALIAALVVYSALKRREAEVQQARVQSVNIVVAAKDLTIGTKLGPDSVKLVRWSRDSMPPGAFTDPGAVVNQFAKTNFVENEPIVGDRLFGGDKNAGVLPLLIPTGMRALSVPVDEVSDISGFVLPHARVDVVVSLSSTTNGGGGDTTFSKIVLQNVEVLAVADTIETIQDKPVPVRVVTLLVTPEEAERLALASREGNLRLAMRNYDDQKIVMTAGVNVQQLLRAYGGPQPEGAPVPQHVYSAPRPRVKPVRVEILRDGKTSESVSFIRKGGKVEPSSDGADANSSAAESADKVASVGGDDHGEILGSTSGEVGPARAPRNAGFANRAASASAPASAGAAAPELTEPAAAGFAAPHSKTIDVP